MNNKIKSFQDACFIAGVVYKHNQLLTTDENAFITQIVSLIVEMLINPNTGQCLIFLIQQKRMKIKIGFGVLIMAHHLKEVHFLKVFFLLISKKLFTQENYLKAFTNNIF
jgi:hypothetical protein